MNFKPSDFFIGLMEFFSIFLPGFIVAFLFKNEILSVFPTEVASSQPYSFPWVIYYFIASYIIGHFVYGAGGFFLGPAQPLRFFFIKKWEVEKAVKIMHGQLRSVEENETSIDEKRPRLKEIKWFQKWADSIIQIRHPELLISIRQFEADSKFFRSFFVVSLIGLVHTMVAAEKTVPFWYWIVGAAVSMFLYFYWKFEAIKDASNVLITMDSLGEFENEAFNKKAASQTKEK